jgi:molybdopterin-containing oxidoreductase family membrane subunit
MALSVAKLFRLEKVLEYFSRLEKGIIFTTRILGIVYLISQLLTIFIFEKSFYTQRLTNHFYTILFFGSILYLFFITQVFWLKRFKGYYTLKFIIGFSFVFSFEKFVIIISSYHRDYLPNFWNYNSDFFYKLLGFIIMVIGLFILNRFLLKNK